MDRRDRLGGQPVSRRRWLQAVAGMIAALGPVAARSPALEHDALTQPPQQLHALRAWRDSIGWGYRVSAEIPYERIVADFRLLSDLGSNTVWLTHANPGWDVDPVADEANFSLKDYVAIARGTNDKSAALRQQDALHRALQAAAETRLRVVLSTGYQTCPGRWWAHSYPADLRRARDGSNPVRRGWGRADVWYAAPDSPRFRELSAQFARYVKEEILDQHPNAEVLAIVNSDEPSVVDYSTHADAAFKRLYGMSMASAQRKEPALLGEFQSRSWGRLSAWFANLWAEVDPRLWNLNTFHFERTAPWFPSIGAIFELARPNSAVSYDSHPQDTALHDPFWPDHLLLLKIMARTVAYHARVHGARNAHYTTTPLMLWAGANRWSLNYAHGEAAHGHANVEQAVTSVAEIVRETKRVGGEIAALLAWHFNIPAQRLPDAMQEHANQAVSAVMRDLQASLSQREATPESPSLVLAYDERRMLATVGKLGIFDLYDRVVLPRVLTRKGWDLAAVAGENSVILPLNSRAYTTAMNARRDVREIRLF